MSNRLIIIFYLFSFYTTCGRESGMTPTMQMFKQLELLICEEFVYPKKVFPDTFEEVEGLKNYVKIYPQAELFGIVSVAFELLA